MTRSGFVLVGGASWRMGRDKALLPLGGSTMVEQIAAQVRAAAGNATLIGPVHKYAHLNLPVVPDAIENCGPLGGLFTALRITSADWNVLVACDMPGVTGVFLKQLFAAAEASQADCLVPESAGKIHPLCAVYHRRLAPAAESAIHHKLFKMQDFISTIRTSRWPVPDARLLDNLNTPHDTETFSLH
jgi:molybdenum cofactor guanylyltransferase